MSEYKLLINGELVDGDAALDVINPATEEVVATCARASERQLDQAAAAAKAAFPGWSSTPLERRRAALRAIADAMEANLGRLTRLLTQEQGKPLADSDFEITTAIRFFRYFADLEWPADATKEDGTSRIVIRRHPIGVVGCIIPWNFPLALLAFKVPAALLAGNTVVLKPAPTTPLTTLLLGRIIKDLVPPGVLNFIADANDLGGKLTKHPDIRKVSFTGSTETGKKVMAGAADALKRVTLELGGNDALIVLDDVDLKRTAPRIYGAAIVNAGQVCVAAKRIYVHESMYDAMCEELALLATETIVGDGLQQGTQMGPLQNRQQFEKVLEFIESARRDGTIIAGGDRKGDKGYFINPTVVRDITDGAKLVDEEQFGPVIPVIKYSDPLDAIQRANASDYGLGGSIWSSDATRAISLAEKMDSGTVWVNKHGELRPDVPFAGVRFSGVGSELGEEGLKEFTQIQAINVAL